MKNYFENKIEQKTLTIENDAIFFFLTIRTFYAK